MTKQEMAEHLRERGVPHVRDGETLRCMDLTQIAGALRTHFDEQGFWIDETEDVEAAPDSLTSISGEDETTASSELSTEDDSGEEEVIDEGNA